MKGQKRFIKQQVAALQDPKQTAVDSYNQHMAKAKKMEAELEKVEMVLTKNGVSATFNGLGRLLSVTIPPNMAKAAMNSTVLDIMIEGYWQGRENQDKKTKELFPGKF